jgi:hypothetical protein
MIRAEQIPDEVVEAAARAIIITNGGDPDALLRLTIHKTTIKAWQQVVPLARAALIAGLSAWPRMQIHTDGTEDWIELTLMQENNNGGD